MFKLTQHWVWRSGGIWLATLGILFLISLPFFAEKYLLKILQKELQQSATQLTETITETLTAEIKGMYRAAMESGDARTQFSALSKSWLLGHPDVLAVHLLDREGQLLKSATKASFEAKLGAEFVSHWAAMNRIALEHALELQEPHLSPSYPLENKLLVNIIIPASDSKQLFYLVTLDAERWIAASTHSADLPVHINALTYRKNINEDYDKYYINTAAWEGIWTLGFQSKDPLYSLLRTLRPLVFALTGLFVGLFFLFWRNFVLRQQAEIALRRKSEILEKQNRLSLLGEMSAQLAHEINQPLATIANYAVAGKLQLQNPQAQTSAAVDALLQEILEQTQRAGQVLVAVRAMLQSNSMELSSSNVDELIRKVEPALRFLCTPSQIRLNVNCATTLLTKLNPLLFEQVIFNLVKNSIQSLNESKKTDKRIDITSTVQNGRIFIEISDNGQGIEAAHLNQIFDSFFTTKTDGLGIGLNLCRSVIERFNGSLTLKSNSELGVCFLIDLPVAHNLSDTTPQ